MRILLVTPSFRPVNGWGTYACTVRRGLEERKYNVAALVHEMIPDNPVADRRGLPPPLSLLDSRIARLRAAWAIARAARAFRPDVIHVLVEPYALAMPLARTLGARQPWVMNLHGTYGVLPLTESSTRRLAIRAHAAAARFFVCSAYTEERVLDALRTHADKKTTEHVRASIQRFTLGIDLPSKGIAPHVPSTTKIILQVGEVKPRKGVREFLLAYVALRRRTALPLHAAFIGTFNPQSEYGQELAAIIQREHLDGHVTFTGTVSGDELEEWYRHADLFVMMSRNNGVHFEGFGLVFLEANLRGIPTIGSRDSGCREAIDEGVSGYAVDPDRPDEVAQRMQWILEEARIKPDACVAWAQKHSVARQTNALEELYRSVIPSG